MQIIFVKREEDFFFTYTFIFYQVFFITLQGLKQFFQYIVHTAQPLS